MSKEEEFRRRRGRKEEEERAPKGHFVVYVGPEEMKRYEVPISYLKHTSFQKLLQESADMYGFHHNHKGIVLPCQDSIFQSVIAELEKGA
ncbi:OLC1v1002614C1 [Oldenlandia corymbosa var. corymbosa]|uniref:OLC1v1002614C1 n=1 Tax=Oldenlandia corymbosa var. corymbosa TaxID=529605 RepID=A0AAV1D999_OLDCO|nr:OLC1v1002614C1 [Oldenlandia corymbosa var. corymbosa]